MAGPAFHTHLAPAQMTTQVHPPIQTDSPLPDAPSYPLAVPVLPPIKPDSPTIEADTQTYRAGLVILDGNVVITSGTAATARRVDADHIEYDTDSGDLTLTGHVIITAALNDERLTASHGTYNLKTTTGTLYDVSGSVGIKPATSSHRLVYTTTNPFLFMGSRVVKSGPRTYDIYDGSVTSCLLPHPDWLLTAAHFAITADKASAHNSIFRIQRIPVFYLPYVTHPTDSESRQSGFLIPTIGQSGTRGTVLGEQIYLTLGRSADLIVGAEYYSAIGFEQNASFRYKGQGLDFITAKYSGVVDQRPLSENQGGEDILLAGRRDLTPNTRAATNIEYLSSYVYREAFSNEFNQAVTSDILSTAFVSTHRDGYDFVGLADRYQGIKLIAQGTTPQQQVRIFHAPTLSISSADHRIASSGIQFSLDASASGLKRSQPNFVTSGIVERFDVHPRLAYPIHLAEWNLVPSVAARETVYSRSQLNRGPGQAPTESTAPLARSSFDAGFELRPPVLERTFAPPPAIARWLGDEVRHTIEPELTYRFTTGINSFQNVLRFDDIDVQSNTNEMEYGVTQRLFRRKRLTKPCRTASDFDGGLNPEGTGAAAAAATSQLPGVGPMRTPTTRPNDCRSEELISWRLTQKYFFDPTFGGAVVNGRRDIFTSTLELSGVAFLTEPRNISPLISRLRVRTSALTDIEWDFDLDTGASKFTSSNVYVDLHQGDFFTALSYARLDAPGRFYTEGVASANATTVPGVSTAVSDFNQLRYLVGYGNPGKAGLSIAANTGLDLKSLYGATSTSTVAGVTTTNSTVFPALFQYAAVQTSYNWNCCGVAFEYRKFNLGTIHNEPGYRFNFTLANIGTAGNLRRAERLF